ncbi:MAG: membrane integrity-associated transporter subunit PqiC [Nitrospirae bacterium]|nr:membrane integrity-associated transporter subunit PqiC [Nitrospirota bacterium]
MLRRFVIIILACVFASCSLPETKIYSLYLPRDKDAKNTKAVSSLTIRLDSPRYLAQPYIARRNSPYELSISKYSKWDAAPHDLVKEAFRETIAAMGLLREIRSSNAESVDFYVLVIHLTKFEMLETTEGAFGEMEFDAVLFSPENKELFHLHVSKEKKLNDKTFASLAKALSNGLAEGINEVKSGISDVLPAR